MACRPVMRSVVLLSPCPRLATPSSSSASASASVLCRSRRSRVRVFHSSVPLRCSSNGDNTPLSSQQEGDLSPPQEVVLKAISEVSKTEGRVAQTTNIIIGGTVTGDATNEWLELDQKVNSYPMVRGFTAIGTGGDDFVEAMVVAVESVLQEPIPKGQVTRKLSSQGKYVSVNIGPIRVMSSEQWMGSPDVAYTRGCPMCDAFQNGQNHIVHQ